MKGTDSGINSTIGITGGIGAGKSVISRVLRCNGLNVYDCDREAKLIMVNDQSVKNSLTDRLGKDVYLTDGNLNRGKLAEDIFSDHELRRFVNGIVHKAVRNDIEEKRKKIEGLFFIESAILVTGGIAPLCNQIWIVTAPIAERITRVIKRDNTDIISVEKRMQSQERELELLESKDIVVLENDNRNPLLEEILKMTDKLNYQQTYSISC